MLKLENTDKIVLQARGPNAPVAPNTLGFFGGHVEDKESPLDAATRELGEETSLPVDELHLSHVGTITVPSEKQPEKISFEVDLYETQIKTDDFEVYEGVGSVTNTVKEFLAMDNLAYAARFIFDYIEHLL